jgi:DNA-binding NarL/FixJ family response regulator
LIKVLVVDDEALLRSAFSSLIEAQDDLEVVGAAADGQQAVDLASRLAPDVVVMDVRMPVMDGIEATRRITRDRSGARVLILTTFDLDEYVFEALRAGASGFALKSRPPEELLSGIRTVADGEALLAPSVTRRLIATSPTAPRHRPRRRGAWTSSPTASGRCSRWWPAACPTPNWRPRCTSRCPRPRRT